jgi:hypothetical protein
MKKTKEQEPGMAMAALTEYCLPFAYLVEPQNKDLNEQQRQQARKWLAEKEWVNAIQVIVDLTGVPFGPAQKLLAKARADGVRFDDDKNPCFAKANELVWWCQQWCQQRASQSPVVASAPKTKRNRYPGDAPLVEEGRKLIKAGWTKSRAAKHLAPRAEGGSDKQRADRLRKMF